MPLDAICLTALTREIRGAALGARIDKIHQPGRDDVVLSLRGAQGACRLLLSASPAHPRAQMTEISRENPDKPPMFCMLLRKHLTGARVLDVTQPPMERVVRLSLEATDELGERTQRALVLECIGRRANLILLDGEGRVVDCLRRVDGETPERRQVLPGLFYRLPPGQEKLDLSALGREALTQALAEAPVEAQTDRWLLDTFGGLSPLVCRELVWRAGGRTDLRLCELGQAGGERLLDALEGLMNDVKQYNFTPIEIVIDGQPKDFTFFPVGQYEGAAQISEKASFAALLDGFYAARETAERVRQKGQDMIRALTSARDRTARRTALQRQELTTAADREHLRRKGDILTTNFYRMRQGMTALRAEDYYQPDAPQIEIALDPRLTPQQNAAKYYKEYRKAANAERALTERIEQGERELDYLDSVLQAVALAEGERDLAQIRQELVETGYLRRASKAAAREKKAISAPMEFLSSAGVRISVGKNNAQNDLLTGKLASKGDLWFHAQKLHGAHVILWTGGAEPDPISLTEAASLAAWYSQGRDSGKVAVDHTPVKFVKKPAGARPGMVVYTTYQTILAAPDGALAERLRRREK